MIEEKLGARGFKTKHDKFNKYMAYFDYATFADAKEQRDAYRKLRGSYHADVPQWARPKVTWKTVKPKPEEGTLGYMSWIYKPDRYNF